MSARTSLTAIALASSLLFSALGYSARQDDAQTDDSRVASDEPSIPASLAEARGRAKLLHDTIHDTLQVMHRDFFDPDNRSKIPSASLEEVFEELAENRGVEVRWLAVNASAMNVEHEPQDDFERDAVKALTAGEKEYEVVEDGQYKRVGVIVLHNVCLKCHVPNRTSLEDRAAGLVISVPLPQK